MHPVVAAYLGLSQLKGLYRQGWLRRGVLPSECESVAEHSFGVTALALWVLDTHYPHLDRIKVIEMALFHDFCEVYAGDITPSDPLPAGEKHAREAASLARVFASLPAGEYYQRLWREFESGETPEARLVRQLDRLEMGLQALVYRAQGYPGMQEFLESARRALQDAPLLAIFDAAHAAFPEVEEGSGHDTRPGV